MQAVSQDPDTARLMGINVDRMIVTAFAVGAALAAVAGVAYGLQTTNTQFRIGFIWGLKAFTAAVLGGIGNIQGAVVGGLVLGVLEAIAIQYLPGGSPWKDVWAFSILILVLINPVENHFIHEILILFDHSHRLISRRSNQRTFQFVLVPLVFVKE